MTAKQEAANWKRLTGGKVPPRPAPPAARPPEPAFPHPERNTDPYWQMKPRAKGGKLAAMIRRGVINQASLDAHFAACERRERNNFNPMGHTLAHNTPQHGQSLTIAPGVHGEPQRRSPSALGNAGPLSTARCTPNRSMAPPKAITGANPKPAPPDPVKPSAQPVTGYPAMTTEGPSVSTLVSFA